MRTGAANFLFGGPAALYSNVAAGCILQTTDSNSLVDNLTAIQGELRKVNSLPSEPLNLFHRAVDGYRSQLDRGMGADIEAAQVSLAQITAHLSNQLWRQGTYPLLPPRDQQLAYLTGAFELLRQISGSRQYVLSAADDDKTFIRTVMGGLNTVLTTADKEENLITGMVEEVAAQMQDKAIQTFADQLDLRIPSKPQTREMGPFAEAPVRTDVTMAASEPTPMTESTEPARPSPSPAPRLSYNYHQASQQALNATHVEQLIQQIDERIQTEGIDWPYDFIRWARSLFLWAGEVREIPSYKPYSATIRGRSQKGLRNSLTHGLKQLASDEGKISVEAINEYLGPTALAVRTPVEGLPTAWPTDMPNDIAATLLGYWQEAQGDDASIVQDSLSKIARVWTYSAGLPKETDIMRKMRALTERIRRARATGRGLASESLAEDTQKLIELLPAAYRTYVVEKELGPYHPASDRRLGAGQEEAIKLLADRMDEEGFSWPGDFVRWARSLYLWTQENPEIPSTKLSPGLIRGSTHKGLLTNITWAFKILADPERTTHLTLQQIRRYIGFTSIMIGHPLPGLPDDWPRDIPNNVGRPLVMAWDRDDAAREECRDIIKAILQLWTHASGHQHEIEIARKLHHIADSLERQLAEGRLKPTDIKERIAAAFQWLATDAVPKVEGA